MSDSHTVGVVLVHGAFHGPWCWRKVVKQLRDAGLAVATPNLYEGPTAADPAVVQADVDRLAQDGPVVVCGHSFGGYPVTALDPAGIARMVYLCAFLPDDCDWYTDLPMVATFFDMVGLDAAGTMTTKPDRARELFYNDCTDDDVAWAVPLMCSHSMEGAGAVTTRPAWREVPSTYALCERDNVLTQPYMEAAMQRVGRGVRIPTGHSPMISRPDLVADIIIAEAQALRG